MPESDVNEGVEDMNVQVNMEEEPLLYSGDTTTTQVQTTNSPMWSVETENIICAIGDYAKCMGRLSIYTSEYYQSQRTYLLGPAAVLSWSLNIFGIVVTYVGNDKISDSLVIMINSLLNFIIATFTTVAEKSNAGSKVELFQQIARDYYSLANMITQEMSRHPNERRTVKVFLSLADTTYKELEKSTPPIPRYIVDAFVLDNRGNKLTKKRELWEEMRKPYILSYLTPTEYSRHRWIHEGNEDEIREVNRNLRMRVALLEEENRMMKLNNGGQETPNMLQKFKENINNEVDSIPEDEGSSFVPNIQVDIDDIYP
jgi:hypothetical protein